MIYCIEGAQAASVDSQLPLARLSPSAVELRTSAAYGTL